MAGAPRRHRRAGPDKAGPGARGVACPDLAQLEITRSHGGAAVSNPRSARCFKPGHRSPRVRVVRIGLDRIISIYDPENVASGHVMEKLGMRRWRRTTEVPVTIGPAPAGGFPLRPLSCPWTRTPARKKRKATMAHRAVIPHAAPKRHHATPEAARTTTANTAVPVSWTLFLVRTTVAANSATDPTRGAYDHWLGHGSAVGVTE